MSDDQGARLLAVIRETVGRISRYRDRALSEQNTKTALIEPDLEALGWDIRDSDEVHREFKPTTKDNPVDYALNVLRKPKLLVETKPLGENLADRKWVGQILGYAAVAGVDWCVLTDGDEYRIYKVNVPLDADEKLFFQMRLSNCPEAEVTKTLTYISRSNLEDNLLEVIWKAHFVDRRVKQTLQDMIGSAHKGLIRLIRSRFSDLKPREIAESLRRLDVRIDSITTSDPTVHARQTAPKRPGGEKKRKQKSHVDYGVTLADLISAGLLVPPLKLFRRYKGTMLEATLLADGAVEYEQQRYATCSAAAESARATVSGRRMNTNGWSFWQYRDADGNKFTLEVPRKRLLDSKGLRGPSA